MSNSSLLVSREGEIVLLIDDIQMLGLRLAFFAVTYHTFIETMFYTMSVQLTGRLTLNGSNKKEFSSIYAWSFFYCSRTVHGRK